MAEVAENSRDHLAPNPDQSQSRLPRAVSTRVLSISKDLWATCSYVQAPSQEKCFLMAKWTNGKRWALNIPPDMISLSLLSLTLSSSISFNVCVEGYSKPSAVFMAFWWTCYPSFWYWGAQDSMWEMRYHSEVVEWGNEWLEQMTLMYMQKAS